MTLFRFIAFFGILTVHFSCYAQLGQTPIPKFDHSVDPECGGLANFLGHGPFDYRKVNQEEKDLVENFHFTPQERMINTSKALTDNRIWGEFDYTLRAFPNNPRALAAVDKLSLILKTDKPPEARYSAKCYFLRAIKFMPDDVNARVLYVFYLIRRNKMPDAAAQLVEVEKLAPEDRNTLYNMGLAYFKVKDYAKSKEYAERAYALGYQLPGLRNLLQGAGKW